MKLYDVTVAVSETVPTYPGDPKVKISVCHSIAGGDEANVSQISLGVHTATHVDAPNHFIEGGRRVDELDLSQLIGECEVIGIDEQAMSIAAHHVAHLKNVERVLFKTRNSQFWNEPERGFRQDFTYLEPEAAKMLVEKGVRLIGIDYLSVEKFGAKSFATHIELLKNEVVIIEGLDLREVSPGTYEMFCLPLKFVGGAGDGAPARCILREKPV